MPPSPAAALRALHRPGDPLLLPNAWDAASARAVAAAGFPAVATSSAAVAETLGHGDGEATPVGEMLAAVARMVSAVAVPVTADLERGYGLRPTELVDRLQATGAAGLNLEDSDPRTGALHDVTEQADLLAAVRAAAGPELVLNARIDVFLRGAGPEDGFDEAVLRARRYLAAGADCVYPIFLTDPTVLGRFVAAVGGPVNALLRPGAPPVAELARLGVARISLGAGVYAATRARAGAMLTALRDGTDPFAS
ncbi:isocitrate lyase/phosphoenolpyruvate mutase family protein [Micromonospora sp. KC721]|uniref:isocitrate lyase/PEP mutase family protein n=1 Tax=Micromonospora sp. KC721 TaxID=2530380 RepID=UPI0010449F14|nr:isocitrate lyase/phosphoenolpyruvate mutase family protein [Micromonospora sp. KC721]TDB79260.1 isocitrate lyase/phosphoenolpyruvate mutase family protein [Micromonospora sp. KC721]